MYIQVIEVHWTWDVEKAEENLRKHKVSFDLAALALSDPFSLMIPNDYPHEERWTTLGAPSSEGTVVRYVVQMAQERGRARANHQRTIGHELGETSL